MPGWNSGVPGASRCSGALHSASAAVTSGSSSPARRSAAAPARGASPTRCWEHELQPMMVHMLVD